MTPTETRFFAELERLAAHCPWEQVDIWAVRQPSGQIKFTAYAAGNRDIGFETAWGNGATPEKAVDDLLKSYPHRDAERCRDEKVARLRLEIDKLLQRQFTFPPFRPTPMIGNGDDDSNDYEKPKASLPRDTAINIETVRTS